MIDPTFFIRSFVALFIIIDPIGNVPLFIPLLEKFRERDRRAMVRMAVMIAAITLFLLTITGNFIFNILSIQMYSFRIAGGILLLIISIEMLFGRKSRTDSSEEDLDVGKNVDIAVTPLAIPLLTGPGAITTGILLFDSARTLLEKAIVLVDIVLVFLLSYLIISRSNLVYKVIGKTGTRVTIRVMGLMLSAIAVQFIISGISDAITAL
ncbi:MAG: MarC family protein [Candidatus Altiarchaeales archaeon]|nr:MarC family protein [Candidatus Altiarchaeota archaeon]MCG2782287.1 MarC family protein [Candidatus Altiarchaeales archaeon]MBU4267169.1 MarC family protein [Candidatus Altiarchaeota archaeon]MBU4340983.1 MarC family protein [Candidatus Altiarchaeota archaeon]MBU4406202.1 MarC family protein [Candidatus Altiarchaeota archaeon]